jgi:hypothetical protein
MHGLLRWRFNRASLPELCYESGTGEGDWQVFKGKLRENRGTRTDEDLAIVNGQREANDKSRTSRPRAAYTQP